jgi:hypothetical protein
MSVSQKKVRIPIQLVTKNCTLCVYDLMLFSRVMRNGRLEAEVFLKQLEVASLQAFNLRAQMEANGIDHSSVPVFQPSNWEDLNLECSSGSDRQIICFLSIFLLKVI